MNLPKRINLRPDLILVDYHMPEMDGLAVVGALKSDAATRGIPAVAFTSGSAAEANQLVRPGRIGFIPKPFEPGTLPEFVAQFLRATVARGSAGAGAAAKEPPRNRLLTHYVHLKLSGFANQAWEPVAPEPQVTENLRSGSSAKSGIVWHSPCFTASKEEAWTSGARSGLGRAVGDESHLRLVSKRGAAGDPGRAGAARQSR
jgi:CheY-like chemotaxis protein